MVRDQHHMVMRFSEGIDSTVTDSLSIKGLGIIAGHIIGPELYLLTEEMAKKDYQFTVVARDYALNRRLIEGDFKGSDRKDTIPPEIIETTPPPFGTNISRYIRGKIRFTEELDTLLTPTIYLKPGTTKIERRWNKDMVRVEFHYPDTLKEASLYHILIIGKISDISKNRTEVAKAFPFTTDSILRTIDVKGKISPACTALIIARNDDIASMSINLPITGYTLYLEDTSNITIEAIRLTPPMIGHGRIADSVITLKDTAAVDLEYYLR